MKSNQLGVLGLLALTLTACGGKGGAGGSASGRGRVKIGVTWPEPSRLIPLASNSIVVTLQRTGGGSGSTNQTLVVSRPTTSAYFDSVVPGTYTVKAEAKPGTDGAGTTQASGTAASTVTVTAGQDSDFGNITMASAVTRLQAAIGSAQFIFDATGLQATSGVPTGSLPAVTGSASVLVDTRNDANALVLVNTATGQLAATGDAFLGAAVTGQNVPDSAAAVTVTRLANGFGNLKVTYGEASRDFNLRFLTLRSIATTTLAQAGALDALPTGVATNGAAATFVPFGPALDGTTTPAFSATPVSYGAIAGYVAGDPIRAGSLSDGRTIAFESGAGNTIKIASPDGTSAVATVANIGTLRDITVVNDRIFILDGGSGVWRIAEIFLGAGNTINNASTKLYTTGAMIDNAMNIAGAMKPDGTIFLAALINNQVRRLNIPTSGLTIGVEAAFPVVASTDIAVTPTLTFVLDAAGQIHTYGSDNQQYALSSVVLPAGAQGLRIAAGTVGVGQNYLVATYSKLSETQVAVFMEAGS